MFCWEEVFSKKFCMIQQHSNGGGAGVAGPWLVRIPEVFATVAPDIVRRLSPTGATPLGTEFYLLKSSTAEAVTGPDTVLHVSWRLPVAHSWPCRPRTMEGFVEKAAQTLLRKFSGQPVQAILVGLLHGGTPNSYYKKLASNLRGRVLQLFPPLPVAEAESQHAGRPTLYCLLGPEGLYAGVASPVATNGFYPGGTKHLPHEAVDAISRAGAKVAEALHYLRLHRAALPKGAHWLELGASPGGMTAELLSKQFRVTAVDRAALDSRLDGMKGLTFVRGDALAFRAPAGAVYDGLLCDLNGGARESMMAVLSHRGALKSGAVVIFTLKLPGTESVAAAVALRDEIVAMAGMGGLNLIAQTHLRANRREFTLFFEDAGGSRPRAGTGADAGRGASLRPRGGRAY